ncbi:MAG: hypothetical protein JXP34_25655 [Planctomycetes bacterium]|nr:hypothetical protein [Planctomycetota bacterium]
MNAKCNAAIQRALDMADELRILADEGDGEREDAACGVLFGVIRDCAYKIKALAQREKDRHATHGTWC